MDRQRWLDIRNHGFFRVGLIIPRVSVGEPSKNMASHLEMLDKAWGQGVEYALCPELGLTGYTCQNLFFQDALLESALDALCGLAKGTLNYDMLVTVGMPLAVGSNLYNCAVSMWGGRIIAVVPKSYLPNYREFWEKLWFAAADDSPGGEVELGGEQVPFGNDLLLCCQHRQRRDVVIHQEICEDGWVPVPPSALAALNDATILANLSASNITIGKANYRASAVVAAPSGSCLAAKLYVSAGFGESTTDLAWDGHAIVAEHGEVIAENQRFTLEPTLLIHDVNVQLSVAERRRQGSFRDNATSLRRRMREDAFLFRRIPFAVPALAEHDCLRGVYSRFTHSVSPYPFVPRDPLTLGDRCREVFDIQATSLAKRIFHRTGTKVILGLSGGLDSTHALLVAVKAMDLLKRSRQDVLCLTMPGFGTTSRTKNNAVELAEALGSMIRTVPITRQADDDPLGIAECLLGLVGHDGLTQDLTFENAQAWCRKVVELTCGAKEGGLVLGTGDLSELALNWCTMFGDHASHYGINAGVAKTLVRFLVQWAAGNVFAQEKRVQAVLSDILQTPISPELLRPNGDVIAQISEEKIGPYDLQDFTLYWGVRFGIRPQTIARLAVQAFEGEYSLKAIVTWQRVFWQRFFAGQYKRNCLPDGPKVGLVCLSPRGDWRMPSDVNSTVWTSDLDEVPV